MSILKAQQGSSLILMAEVSLLILMAFLMAQQVSSLTLMAQVSLLILMAFLMAQLQMEEEKKGM